MSAETIWEAFAETGDPLVYLLYRAAHAQTEQGDKTEKARGIAPG